MRSFRLNISNGFQAYPVPREIGCLPIVISSNGNDIIEINNIAQKSIDFIKKNQSPVLLTIDTYRYREHCGPNYDNDLNYRSLKEFKKWKKNDPIKLFENKLLKQKIINLDFLSKIKTKNKNIIDRVFSNSKLKKLPKPQEAKNYVYA